MRDTVQKAIERLQRERKSTKKVDGGGVCFTLDSILCQNEKAVNITIEELEKEQNYYVNGKKVLYKGLAVDASAICTVYKFGDIWATENHFYKSDLCKLQKKKVDRVVYPIFINYPDHLEIDGVKMNYIGTENWYLRKFSNWLIYTQRHLDIDSFK